MPCRLNDDVHEWFNEVATVPNQNLPKPFKGVKTLVTYWDAKTF